MLRMYSAVLRLCTSLDAMLQGLICMLDFVAIAILILLFAINYTLSASVVGFLGVQPISGDCKERVTLCLGFSGEKRPEWVIRAKP